jgi:hypothetical protein
MKNSIFTPVLLVVLLMATNVKAQMGIGTATPNAAAQLDVSSTTKGFLAPRMTQAQRDLISTSATSKGLLIYQIDGTAGFYYHDGTSWISLSAISSAAGVDLTTNQYVGGLKTFTSNDGFLATGTSGSGTASSLGAGTRMMWYPKKAAFRAGQVNGTQWDDANIGDASAAMGYGTTASGYASTALGSSTIASGTWSAAIGYSSTASGQNSTAMGTSTTASGTRSTSMGSSTTASNDYSTSMGSSTIASGPMSTSMGSSTIASGSSSTAMGNTSTASGAASTAMGYLTIASGSFSTAMGNTTTAKSLAETAIGTYNTVYTPTNTFSFNATDRLFVIGNGTSSGALSDALVMLKNGNTTIGGSLALNGNGTGTSYTFPTSRGTANYVLTTDGVGGTSWAAASGGSGSGVDLTTDQSVGGLKTFTSNDGLLATGTSGSGTASSLGAGTRMMWYPKKAAFRAGAVDGTQWDDANIGGASAAMGYKTKASGSISFAIGSSTTASGGNSTAMGGGTTASGGSSTAMGSLTIASGEVSTAMGGNTTASGGSSTAMGSNTIASGQNSTAMGGSTTASATNSTAMGSNTIASGEGATAMGGVSTASGYFSTAMGNSTTASAYYSTAMGFYTTAKSLAETAIGTYNTTYTPTSATLYNSADRLFVIGNGTSSSALSDALVILKNGNTTFSGTVTATVVAPTSDIRLKRNIIPLKNSIDALMQLNPVSYEKKNSLTSTDFNIKENGFIAQELQKVMPSLVVEGTDKDKLLSVNYTAIIPMLTKAIQEQQKEIAELKKMVELLMKK